MLIPQISFHANALRLAMIACGTVALSLLRRDTGEAVKEAMASMGRYALMAIRNLSSLDRPPIETVLIIWTFWQLDMLCGNMKSSMMHIISAQKLALENPSKLASDALASSLVQSMTEGMPVVRELEAMMMGLNVEAHEPSPRKQLVLNKLWTAHRLICECYHRAQSGGWIDKTKTPCMLAMVQKEIEWILSRWEEPGDHLQWLENNRSNDISVFEPSVQASSPKARDPGPFQRIVDSLGPYLASKRGLPIYECLQRTSIALLLLLIVAAGSNLEMRQDIVEFLEFSNRIRQIPAVPTMDHANVWVSFADLVSSRLPVPVMDKAAVDQIQAGQDVVLEPCLRVDVNGPTIKVCPIASFGRFELLKGGMKALLPERNSDD